MRAMAIRRGVLYSGVFLLAIGIVTLADAAGSLDRTAVASTVAATWPIAVIAVGVALLLRHTPAALPAGVVAAAAPGLLIGGSLMAIPPLPSACTSFGTAGGPTQTHQGTITDGGRVDLQLACGELSLTTTDSDAWRLDSRDGTGRQTTVATEANGFSVTTSEHGRGWTIGRGSVAWSASLPRTAKLDLSTQVAAGRATLDLSRADLGAVTFDVDAGDLQASLTQATLDRLAITANAGSASVTLPAEPFIGSVTANAGSVRLCVPAGLALRITSSAALGAVEINGLVQHGDTWSTPSVTNPSATADLTLSAQVGSVAVNPQGGCQ
jgi:hypothetical protein